MPVTCTAASLASSASAFMKLSRSEGMAVFTYLCAAWNGGSQVPQTLMANAQPFLSLDYTTHMAIHNYLLCTIYHATGAGGSFVCSAQNVMSNAQIFASLSRDQVLACQNWLITQIVPTVTDPQALLFSARAFLPLDDATHLAIQTYCLCNRSNH